MNKHQTTTLSLIVAFLIAGTLAIAPATKAATASAAGSEEINRLLAEVKAEAAALERDAVEIAAWTRARQMSWESHATNLRSMREHVNQAGQLLTRLNEAREGASLWQQEAIDRIHPLLKELADNTQSTINHLSDNQDRIYFPPYTDYAKAGADLAQELAALVSDYTKFGELEEEFHRLQEKLQPAAS
jgi:DNA repair exonuclease SbcCD ATPase subunit